MRLLHYFLFLFICSSCQPLYTNIPKGTLSDESITQLTLDYRMISSDKVMGTIQNNSKNRVYDVRIRIDITRLDHSVSTEHFVIAKINPYQNYSFKKSTETLDGVEMTLRIQSSHY
ncbi:hypothetical protein [Fluviicola chungangensis]|uniref:Uncharacterized protein n=1 Tax=Fluviicola chungangensis TaxID=2597671 RepID=A0A556MN25_9FLAO|nr:hypothetical protein [Fluviicola chungangensis]TSJ41341.1 hypothetical protein FO442_15635 [Fluviicola chungangensis]